ncbi:MAG: SOS response-associated peptidase [Cyclobacteriaceae bacterium]
MIDRYSLAAPPTDWKSKVDWSGYEPVYNAGPGCLLPVITHHSPRGLSFFYWGMPPAWVKNDHFAERSINIQAESIAPKPVLRKNLLSSRCLVLADGFYAWKKVSKKGQIPYRFTLKSRLPFFMAALWEEFEDAGDMQHTFRLITTLANEEVQKVTDRMPAILQPGDEQVWLNGEASAEDLLSRLTPYPAALMDHYPVTPQIQQLNFNSPLAIRPTAPADQFGNLRLFD